MGVFGFFSYTRTVQETSCAEKSTVDSTVVSNLPLSLAKDSSKPTATVEKATLSTSTPPISGPNGLAVDVDVNLPSDTPKVNPRRFSLRPFSFSGKISSDTKPALSAVHEQEKRTKASQDLGKRSQMVQISKSDKRVHQSALAIRELIVGPTSAAAPKLTSIAARPQLDVLKTQLMQPKSANKLIMHLRALPAYDEVTIDHGHHPKGPIHAVCLEHTDEEEHRLHFSKLVTDDLSRDISTQNVTFQGVTSASLDQITCLFNEMHVVDLIGSPDFGLGQPGDGKGILAGAVPTAETVIQGFRRITPELMALGYATGKAITPDHSGMHPPTDRMSLLTYWWGLELLLPPPSLWYLTRAQSVSGSLMNFLSALALVNNGIREILPFIRYIAQFVDFEFSAIKAQDRGHGVVCAATWIMPAALVPRPWDFPLFSEVPTNSGSGVETKTNSMPLPSSLLDIVAQSSVPSSPAKYRGVAIKAGA